MNNAMPTAAAVKKAMFNACAKQQESLWVQIEEAQACRNSELHAQLEGELARLQAYARTLL